MPMLPVPADNNKMHTLFKCIRYYNIDWFVPKLLV